MPITLSSPGILTSLEGKRRVNFIALYFVMFKSWIKIAAVQLNELNPIPFSLAFVPSSMGSKYSQNPLSLII